MKCLLYFSPLSSCSPPTPIPFRQSVIFLWRNYETHCSSLITLWEAGCKRQKGGMLWGGWGLGGERGFAWTSSKAHLGGLITSKLCLISRHSYIPAEHVEGRQTLQRLRNVSVSLPKCTLVCQAASDRRPNPVGRVQMRWHVWQDAEPFGWVNRASGENEKVKMKWKKNLKLFYCCRLQVRVLNSCISILTTSIRCHFQSVNQ